MSVPKLNPARERHWMCAQRMRERRLALGLTQREVVERLLCRGSHTTNRALSAMENGRGLDLGLLPELADSLDCTTTYLLGLTADPSSWSPADRQPPADHRSRVSGTNGTNGTNGFHAVHGVLGELPEGFTPPRRRVRSTGGSQS